MDQNGLPIPSDLSVFPRAVRLAALGSVVLFVGPFVLSVPIGLVSA